MEKNKGITLVSLVITIVILLILAGISIQAITNTGLLKNAKQAKEEQKKEQEKENLILTDYTEEIGKYVVGKRDEIANESYKDLENVSKTFFTKMLLI